MAAIVKFFTSPRHPAAAAAEAAVSFRASSLRCARYNALPPLVRALAGRDFFNFTTRRKVHSSRIPRQAPRFAFDTPRERRPSSSPVFVPAAIPVTPRVSVLLYFTSDIDEVANAGQDSFLRGLTRRVITPDRSDFQTPRAPCSRYHEPCCKIFPVKQAHHHRAKIISSYQKLRGGDRRHQRQAARARGIFGGSAPSSAMPARWGLAPVTAPPTPPSPPWPPGHWPAGRGHRRLIMQSARPGHDGHPAADQSPRACVAWVAAITDRGGPAAWRRNGQVEGSGGRAEMALGEL